MSALGGSRLHPHKKGKFRVAWGRTPAGLRKKGWRMSGECAREGGDWRREGCREQ